MTTTINGLHSCKPGNEPVAGETKTFVIEQHPAKNGKKAWTKIKSAGAKFGGEPYRILSAEPTGYTDDYGNISFNLEIEPAVGGGGGENTQKPVQAASSPSQNRYGSSNIPVEDQPEMPPFKPVRAASALSQYPHDARYDTPEKAARNALQAPPARPISKDEYWQRKLEHEIAREPHITRMHSQSMALEVLKLKVTLNELTVEDLTPAKLRSLADYFDQDVLGATQ